MNLNKLIEESKFNFLQLIDLEDGVVEVKMNRPEVHNAFNDIFIEEVNSCFSNFNSVPDITLVVLSAEGKSFSAGADLNWMKSMVSYSKQQNQEDSTKLLNMFQAMDNLKCPLIGVVQGAALGGGMGIVSCCDHVLSSDRAKFGFTEVRLGLVPAVISEFVYRKIGYSQCVSLFASGEIFKANKAYDIGLVHQVVSGEDLEEAKNNIISQLKNNGPMAMTSAKSLAKGLLNFDPGFAQKRIDFQEKCVELIADTRVTNEAQEGMNALLEKRTANWIKDEN
ncbi:enoyl-CoA hydratase-related protein [Bacteriovoracaceae bacterium]|nr:enoyl-CoA hydratase-related protein [Bacteriovoracaceae bacterium]